MCADGWLGLSLGSRVVPWELLLRPGTRGVCTRSSRFSLGLGNRVEDTVRSSVLVLEPKVRRMGCFSPNEPYRSGLAWAVRRREPELLREAAAQPGVSPLSPGAPGRRELEVRMAPEASFPKPC